MEFEQIEPTMPVFSATLKEKLAALVSYPVAYLYVCFLLDGRMGLLAAFAAAFCLCVELMHRERRAGWERWVWLGSLAVCVGALLFGKCRIWGELGVLFVHGFAVYYTLCRADVLYEGRTGRLLPLDCFNGAVLLPFGSLFLRIRVVVAAVRDGAKRGRRAVAWTLAAVALAAALFLTAGSLLTQADDGFAQLITGIFGTQPELSLQPFALRAALSIPVGAFLYGLVAGAGRLSPARARARGERTCVALAQLRKVPNTVWSVLLGVFCLLYLVFFVIQGSYLFGAFTRTLPAEFTVAQYARQGFFELCGVMLVNFVLLWLAMCSAERSARERGLLRGMATALLAESMLLALTAGSKLWLYIDCFGFTPLRLQSAWLIAVLFTGCCAALWSLWTGRRSVRAWAIFSGVSLALLQLY